MCTIGYLVNLGNYYTTQRYSDLIEKICSINSAHICSRLAPLLSEPPRWDQAW